MLTDFSETGHLRFTCPCGVSQEVHFSHEEVQFRLPAGRPAHHRTVALPPCTCGKQMFLKVDFSPEELAHLSTHDADPEQMRAGIPTTRSQEAAARHMALARQMERAGKTPIAHPPAMYAPSALPYEQVQAVVAHLLAPDVSMEAKQAVLAHILAAISAPVASIPVIPLPAPASVVVAVPPTIQDTSGLEAALALFDQ